MFVSGEGGQAVLDQPSYNTSLPVVMYIALQLQAIIQVSCAQMLRPAVTAVLVRVCCTLTACEVLRVKQFRGD